MIVNAYSTLREPPEIDFEHTLSLHRELDDPAMVPHLGDMMGLACDRGRREMSATVYAVMRHLERTRHHYRFEIDDDALDGLAVWGWQSNSILMTTDQSFRDPARRILVHGDTGEAEGNATVPFPIDAIDRAADTRQAMSAMGLDVPHELPPVVGVGEVTMRSDDDIGWRMLALFITAVRAESLAASKGIPAAQLKAKSPMAFEALTPLERGFIEADNPDQQSIVNFAWRYEALYTLQWAVGMHSELKFADEICDVPLVAETMVNQADREIVTSVRLRPVKQILDALDMNLRLLWAARAAAMEQRECKVKLDGGVLSERQHALNWLVRFGGVPWDEVDTPT
ncbi:hypothetical protein Poly51_08130 [Rubripirellula tenax]|uniref:DUF4272 domain-containing protein n=1 Tax=Rubripirellula tenax TaxID=2528015 RepID=A0A5C6FKK2_9BACT|nr:DUF4272 domain-containing protein [Rubripirellula tenax]TWU60537.1 hypothetical protein Poly51_08130 [Rubripirellula tenax]